MNCDGVRGLLSAYVDGELSAGELLRVEQHLRRCHWCADEVDALRQTIGLVASLEEVELPAAFSAQLHNRLVALGPPVQAGRTIPAARTQKRDMRRWAVPAAAAAALVIGMTGLNQLAPVAGLGKAKPPLVSERTPGAPEIATTGTPGVGGNSTGGTGETVKTTTPGTPVASPPAVTPAPTNPATPLGPTTPNSNGVHTVTANTYLDGLSSPTGLPAQSRLGATLTAAVADPAALAASLRQSFAAYSLTEQAGADGSVTMQITLPAAAYANALAQAERLTGVGAVDTSEERGLQLAYLFAELQALESRRADHVEMMKALTDATAIAQAEKFLADLNRRAQEAQVSYKAIADEVSTSTISVTLKRNATQ